MITSLAAISIETLSRVMIFCDGIWMATVNPRHLLDRKEDQGHSRPTHAFDPAEEENHAALMLLENAK